MAQLFAQSFYKSQEWKDCRAAYIKKVNGLCEDCLDRGLYVPGVIVHHITHITKQNINNPSVTLSFDNLRLVCRQCHGIEHKTINTHGGRYIFDEDGNISPL